jgi:hypothetical protein
LGIEVKEKSQLGQGVKVLLYIDIPNKRIAKIPTYQSRYPIILVRCKALWTHVSLLASAWQRAASTHFQQTAPHPDFDPYLDHQVASNRLC